MKKISILFTAILIGLMLSIGSQHASASEFVPLIPPVSDEIYDANYGNPDNLLRSEDTDEIKWYVDRDSVLHYGRGKFAKYPKSSIPSENEILDNVVGIEFNQESFSTVLVEAFYYSKVKFIHGLENLDVSKVRNMKMAFTYASEITYLDLSGWDTSGATHMDQMFSSMDKVIKIDVSNFNTSNVVTMASMFNGNIELKELDVSNFDTSQVEDLSPCSVDVGP